MKDNSSNNNLKNLSNVELLKLVHKQTQNERQACLWVLKSFVEISERKLFAARAYSSLHEFAVSELKFSDGAAFRRVKASKLLEKFPDVIEPGILDGSFSLTGLSQLQNFFEKARKQKIQIDNSKKLQLLQNSASKSKLEIEKLLIQEFPEMKKNFSKESRTRVSPTETRVSFLAHDELIKSYNRLCEIFNLHGSMAENLEIIFQKTLNKFDPVLKKGRNKNYQQLVSDSEEATSPEAQVSTEKPIKRSRYISQNIRQNLWQKHGARCAFVDPLTKRRCSETKGLEVDHQLPFAFLGSSDENNLRLLCRQHNLFEAERSFGVQKMRQYSHCKESSQ